MEDAILYKNLDEKTVQCGLCSHFCTINEGRLGTCGVRVNKDGKLKTMVYGYPVETNVDPIEKKPLFHFQPGSQTFSLGTFGCNLTCANCHNWNISQHKKNLEDKIQEMGYHSPESIVEEALGNDCASISYTYNEPTIFAEYALDIMKLAHENGLKNVWVSNGFMSPELLKMIIPYLDAVNIDLKSIDEDFYKNSCGARLEPVLENLRMLKEEQIHMEITTLVIPGLSDDMAMLTRLANFISEELDIDTPWHISRFSSEISWKLQNLESTGEDLVYQAYEIGREAGLKYVYVGNIPGDQKENTYCPKCGELAIRRYGYEIERLDDHGCCPACEKDLDIVE